jgi:hypothetical protein
MRAGALAAALALSACSSSSSSPPADACPLCQPPPTVCNGHAELCSRAYDQVTFPGTHDAYSDISENFQAPDQTYTLARQLEDGVRVLHLELKPNLPDDDQALLCHGLCALGEKPLADDLAEVVAFLSTHPDEVVTLLTEAVNLTTDVIAGAFQSSGLLPMVRTQAAGTSWPTLSEIIQSGQRVVVFYVDQTGTGGTSFPWLLDRFSWTWETPWDNEVLTDFARCHADRGTQGNDLYVVDTYLEDVPIQTAANAARVNPNPFLVDRLLYCQKSTGARPNFVMVNYYEVGDVFRDVDLLNGFGSAGDPDAGAAPPAAFDPTGAGDAAAE